MLANWRKRIGPTLYVTLPIARCTETSAWLTDRDQRRRQWIDLTFWTESSTSFTELNSIPLGEPEKQNRISNGCQHLRCFSSLKLHVELRG